ncbi:hypothetical protein H6L04_12520, partial [Staphylococcus lugdunensis]|nr:hypothetical protein [Staphylococcus lugdunensis]
GIKSITPQANGDKLVTFTDNRTMVIPKGDKGEEEDKWTIIETFTLG